MCGVGTMSAAVNPVVTEVHSQQGEPPGPGRVPGQLQQPVPLPDVHVCCQLTASHQQPAAGTITAPVSVFVLHHKCTVF